MQTRFFFACGFALSTCLIPALLPAAALHKLTPRESVPVGMEMHYAGTSLVEGQGVLNGESLIRDHTAEAHLVAGSSRLIFKFSRQAVLNGLSFINDGMQGQVCLFASHDGREWTALSRERYMPADRQVSLNPGCAQARYVKLEFDSRQGGTIRCLRLQGGDSDLDYQVVQDNAGGQVNFASGLGGGRMVYASPAGSGNERMVVYDLGQPRQVEEFASVHSRQPVALKVYALTALPEKEDWRGRFQADPAQVERPGQLVAEAEDAFGSGHVRIRLKKPVTTRYLAMAWRSQSGLAHFKAYEIAASGPAKVRHAPRTTPSLASNEREQNRSVSDASAGAAAMVPSHPLNPPTPAPGFSIGAYGFGAGVMQAGGGAQPAKFRQGSLRAIKAQEEPPPDEEIPEFEGPAFGIEWCLSPSAA